MCFHVCMGVVLFMCVYTRTSVCVYIHVLRMYTCVCVYTYVCVRVYTCGHARMHLLLPGYVGIHAPMVFVRMFVLSHFARLQEAASYTA